MDTDPNQSLPPARPDASDSGKGKGKKRPSTRGAWALSQKTARLIQREVERKIESAFREVDSEKEQQNKPRKLFETQNSALSVWRVLVEVLIECPIKSLVSALLLLAGGLVTRLGIVYGDPGLAIAGCLLGIVVVGVLVYVLLPDS